MMTNSTQRGEERVQRDPKTNTEGSLYQDAEVNQRKRVHFHLPLDYHEKTSNRDEKENGLRNSNKKISYHNHYQKLLALTILGIYLTVTNHHRTDYSGRIRVTSTSSTTRNLAQVVDSSEASRNIRRTAVVWTTRGILSTCELDRIRQLVETSPEGMDVWLMHSHPELIQQGEFEHVEISQNNIEAISGLQHWPQNESGFDMFDKLAGNSKSSLLRFLMEHQSQYDYAWIVENDMFYTGPWEDIFRSETIRDTTTDFLSMQMIPINGTEWVWNTLRKCTLWDQPCIDIENIQSPWMFARVSSRLAISLLNDLEGGHIQGFHEAVLAPYCRLKNFTFGNVDPTKVGEWQFGHMKKGIKKRDMDVAFLNPQPMGKQLIHPVKCEAYDKNNRSILPDIEKWTTHNKLPDNNIHQHM